MGAKSRTRRLESAAPVPVAIVAVVPEAAIPVVLLGLKASAARPLHSPMGHPSPQHAVTASSLRRALPPDGGPNELKIDLMLAVAWGSKLLPPSCNGAWSAACVPEEAAAARSTAIVVLDIQPILMDFVLVVVGQIISS